MTKLILDQLEGELCKLPIVKSVLDRLGSDLSPNLKYHSLNHSIDVVHEALLFGIEDNLPERDLHLLAIAAAYHDSGFLIRSVNNEIIGSQFAEEAMQQAGGYTSEEIQIVQTLILDTEINWEKGVPIFRSRSMLSGYLLDADLSNFGREDFFEKSRLFAEETNQQFSEVCLSMKTFLEKHKWHTHAALRLRTKQKEKNLAELVSGFFLTKPLN